MKFPLVLSLLCLTSTYAVCHVCDICDTSCKGPTINPPLIYSPCYGFSGQIDALYYQAQNQITPYIETSSPGNGHAYNKTKTLDGDANAGFRFAIHHHLPCDRWKLSASWLHYDHKTSIQKDTSWNNGLGTFINMPYGLTPLKVGMPTFDATAFFHSQAQHSLSMNEIDVRLLREFFVGPCLTLTPHAGVKAQFITSRYAQEYEIFLPGDILDISTRFHAKTDFKAVGIASGLESNWLISCSLSLYVQGAMTLYYSAFDLFDTQENFKLYPYSPLKQTAREQFQTLTYQFDYSLGVRWMIPFHEHQSMFALHLGWEGKYLPEMNRIAKAEQTSRAPLILHGIGLGVSLTY